MSRTITIDPVTRIEGHARVFLDLASDGSIAAAGLVVNELRGFERILVGMEADRLPLLTARICGVCPTAHHLVASKALDVAAGVEPPPAAKLLRELMFLGHFIHSHSLSLFVLQGPDLVLGLDAPAATRNVVGVVQAAPEVAKKALRLRTLGQKINELVGGRGTHPVTSVAGGISFQPDSDQRRILRAWSEEALGLVSELAVVAKGLLLKRIESCPELLDRWVLPTWYLGTNRKGRVNFYDGRLRAVDSEGIERLDFSSKQYGEHLAESTLGWSYMKPVHLRDGAERRTYRVGALARLNCAEGMETPAADEHLRQMRAAFGNPCHATVLHAYARLIELVYACERACEISRDDGICGETRVPVKFRAGRAVAHVEAPRGVLIHDYEIDDDGIVRAANLIVATQQNYDAINQSIRQAAETHVVNRSDGALLNAVEFAIRCYDPCLSCATHALGQMPLELVLREGGQELRRVRRDR
jgi:F420-non-reducing hydrogenase large subunit